MPKAVHPRRARRTLLDVELDSVQREAARRPPGRAMLVLGEAGHGKTTVALHRTAHLYEAAGGRLRATFLVPGEGLRLLLQPLLTWLGADVAVSTYDAWALRQGRRAFGDLPRRLSRNASAGATRIKRDAALRPLLEELATRPPGVIDDDLDAPPPATRALAHRGDLQHLFGDRRLMERLARSSSQGVGAHAIDEVLEHTRVQFGLRGERANAHVDRERLITVDARSLDHATPEEDAESVDAEDIAVLFELDRLRARLAGGKARRPRPFDLIVIDEAQELAPLELALIGRSLARSGTLVVAGDADQQTDPTVSFFGWEATMRELGALDFDTVTLEVGYRCPPEVVELARAVRDGRRVREVPFPWLRAHDERALAAAIAAEVGDVDSEEPTCVIVRSAVFARRLSELLTGLVPRRLVLDGDFRPHPGVDVTTVDQVKGLEFERVIVADATAGAYPDTPAARRAMYVAVTRARRGLSFAGVGAPTPILDDAA
jgi:DNA helicase II / ATP-dependent DNA helicase PcrA